MKYNAIGNVREESRRHGTMFGYDLNQCLFEKGRQIHDEKLGEGDTSFLT